MLSVEVNVLANKASDEEEGVIVVGLYSQVNGD